MKMIDILEKDKDHLLTELTAADSPDKAVIALENEIDKLLLRYNERCDSERERDAAAYMMQAVRLALPLIDSTGRTKVWEHDEGKADKAKTPVMAIILLIAGIALLIFGLFPIVMLALADTDPSGRTELFTRFGSVFSGIVVLFISGALFGRPKTRKTKELHIEIRVDAEKIYRHFRTAILSVDQSLEEIRANERWSKREQAGNIDGRKATTPEIELFSDLLAASYSNDPEYALEKIDEIKYFLHKQQIEVIDYSENTRQYFDLMPGTAAGTIRPALIADGALLKKGLASTGK